MKMLGRAVAVMLTAVTLGSGDARAQTIRDSDGSWNARISEEGEGRLHIRVSRWDQDSRWESDLSLDPETGRRVLGQLPDGEGDVRFTVEREAGVLTFEGNFRRGRGMGEFAFTENEGFRDTMRQLGYGRLDSDEVFSAALLDVGQQLAREMDRIGFRELDFDELVTASIFDINAEYVREMRDAGLGDLDFDEYVSSRVFDIDAAFVAEARHLGLGPLDHDDLVAMKVHGLDRDFMESLRDVDINLRDFDDALAFRIHGITAEWIRELQDEGFEDLTTDDLMKIRIHGLDDIMR